MGITNSPLKWKGFGHRQTKGDFFSSFVRQVQVYCELPIPIESKWWWKIVYAIRICYFFPLSITINRIAHYGNWERFCSSIDISGRKDNFPEWCFTKGCLNLYDDFGHFSFLQFSILSLCIMRNRSDAVNWTLHSLLNININRNCFILQQNDTENYIFQTFMESTTMQKS